MKRRGILLIAGLLSGLLLGGCGNSSTESAIQRASSTVISETSAAESVENTLNDSSSLSGETTAVENDIIISTKYGNLHFDGQWRDSVKTEESYKNDEGQIQFAAVINSNQYPLFTVIIGGDAGDPVGTLTDNDGISRKVFIEPQDLAADAQLSEDEQNRYYAMKESVNYLIDYLK